MLARAKQAQKRWPDRVLTPYEAFRYLADEEEIEILDVRTTEQRIKHEINGAAGVSVRGALHVPLDELVSGEAALPEPDQPLILVCSRGPKSLVALDFLALECPRAVCVEGGITAWDTASLPVESIGGEDEA